MQVYADNAATTKVSRTAVEAMLPCFSEFYGNPSSLHQLGQQAKGKLQKARGMVASCIGCQPREVYFTSGGTEADNQAILTGAMLGEKQGKKHVITTAFEHPAVLNTMKCLEARGFTVTYLPVDPLTHNISAEQVKNALRQDTCLVSAMYANNEIGSILPIPRIGAVCRQAGVLLHVDAVQAAGQIPVDVQADCIDFLSISGHKFGGPKGVGALYARKDLNLNNLMNGGGQERGKRPGTENLPGICGMAAALEEACSQLAVRQTQVTAMREKLRKGLSQIPDCLINGDQSHHLPGILNVCFPGTAGESLLVLLDSRGICASAGSACSSGSLEPSHVLLAAGRSREEARSSLRLSLSRDNTMEEIDYLLEEIPKAVAQLRNCD